MHIRARTVVYALACALIPLIQAAAQVPSRIDSLSRALTTLSGRIDSLEAGLCPADTPIAMPQPSGDRKTDSLALKLQQLDRRLAGLRATRRQAAAPAPSEAADSNSDLAAIRAAAAAAAGQSPQQAGDTSQKKAEEPPPAQAAGPRGAN